VHGVHHALQPPFTQVCYSCGQEDSEGLDLQSADYSNEMYCGSCLNSCESSQCWWGRNDRDGEEDECEDNCDPQVPDDLPVHTLNANETWKEGILALQYLIRTSQENARLVPSIRPSKTPYYSLVTKGNQFRNFAHESNAVKKTMDRLRKQVQNKAKLEKEREEACLKVMNHYFICQRTVETLTTEVFNEMVSDDALLDVNEELDHAMRDMTRDTAIHTSNATLTDRERVQHLVKCLESRKGLNMAKQHQHAQYEYSIRGKKMSELQAGRHIAETCYGDQRDGRSNASSGKQ
jgi:hypothetical protein